MHEMHEKGRQEAESWSVEHTPSCKPCQSVFLLPHSFGCDKSSRIESDWAGVVRNRRQEVRSSGVLGETGVLE